MCININRNVFEHIYNVNCGKPYLRPCWYFCPDYQRSLLNYAIVIFAVDFLLIYLNMHLPVNENYHIYINVYLTLHYGWNKNCITEDICKYEISTSDNANINVILLAHWKVSWGFPKDINRCISFRQMWSD